MQQPAFRLALKPDLEIFVDWDRWRCFLAPHSHFEEDDVDSAMSSDNSEAAMSIVGASFVIISRSIIGSIIISRSIVHLVIYYLILFHLYPIQFFYFVFF